MTHAHFLAAAAYHMAHALRMERRGLVYGAAQMRLLAQRAMEQAGEEASR